MQSVHKRVAVCRLAAFLVNRGVTNPSDRYAAAREGLAMSKLIITAGHPHDKKTGRVDAAQVDVWHVDVRDVDHFWLVDVRDFIEGCVVDGSRAELDMRWTRDEGGKNRRCGGGSGRERCEIGAPNPHGSRPSEGPS